jgi:hypothetical protein
MKREKKKLESSEEEGVYKSSVIPLASMVEVGNRLSTDLLH